MIWHRGSNRTCSTYQPCWTVVYLSVRELIAEYGNKSINPEEIVNILNLQYIRACFRQKQRKTSESSYTIIHGKECWADEEKIWGNRDLVLQNYAENNIDEACEQRGRLTENKKQSRHLDPEKDSGNFMGHIRKENLENLTKGAPNGLWVFSIFYRR